MIQVLGTAKPPPRHHAVAVIGGFDFDLIRPYQKIDPSPDRQTCVVGKFPHLCLDGFPYNAGNEI